MHDGCVSLFLSASHHFVRRTSWKSFYCHYQGKWFLNSGLCLPGTQLSDVAGEREEGRGNIALVSVLKRDS